MNTPQPKPHLETMDLAISSMDTHLAEERAANVLKQLKGVVTVTTIQRGATIHYDSSAVTRKQIIEALRKEGFEASVFQDSASGETGHVSF